MKTLALTLMMTTAAAPAIAQSAGLRLEAIDAPHHDTVMTSALWYPSTDAPNSSFADNPLFVGVDVAQNASIAPGTHPVIALSHGMGGGIESVAWLAAGLAERGAIVVAVSHPNSTWSDFDMTEGIKHWTRAQDLSAALDAVFADSDLAEAADASRVMALGFSFGGWTALSMGGLRGNHAGVVSECEAQMDRIDLCGMLLSDNVRLQDVDPADWNAAYGDPRITHVTAIDPGFVWGPVPDDAADMVDKVTLIGLGAPETRLSATDFETSGFGAMMPMANITWIAPATHFTAMPVCKPGGEDILEAEGDDPVCTDPTGTNRAAVHQQLIDQTAAALGL